MRNHKRQYSPAGKKLTKADIEQLLGEQYLVKETDDVTDPAIASLFVKNAGSGQVFL